MKNSNFFAMTVSMFLLPLFSTISAAQQRTMILKQGNYSTADENPNDLFGHCSCGTAFFDCICGFVDYHDTNAEVPFGQIAVGVSSQVVSGNTLQIKFKEKLRDGTKTNDFTQKETVVINPDIAESLGSTSITILPGTYTIGEDNSLIFNIERGEPYTTIWGWIVIVIIVIIVWGVGGGTIPSTGSNGGVPSGQGCDFCKLLPIYWAGLSPMKKLWMLAWYLLEYYSMQIEGLLNFNTGKSGEGETLSKR